MADFGGKPASTGSGITALKQVQVSNGSQIDLLFDGKVQKSQIRTEYLGDIIQLSIQDVSVYPAKISSVNGGELTKVFAYQYAPKLVRCRLSVKGKAEDYKDKLEIKAQRKDAHHSRRSAPSRSSLTVHAAAGGASSRRHAKRRPRLTADTD